LIKIKLVLSALLATLFVAGAEKTAASSEQISYTPGNVKIVGVLDYGQTSPLVESSGQYAAFVFNGNGNDKVEVTVTGDRNAFVAIADPTLSKVASGTGSVSVELPYRGPDTEAFYIVFKSQTRSARLILRKTGGSQPSPDATR
jgi:hypothetical protein